MTSKITTKTPLRIVHANTEVKEKMTVGNFTFIIFSIFIIGVGFGLMFGLTF